LFLPTPNSEEAVYFQFHAVPHPTWTLHDGTCGMTKIAIPTDAPKPKADAVRARLHGEYQRHAYDLLVDLLATIGEKGRSGVPDNLPSAPEQAWRDAFYARSMPGAKPETKQKRFREVANAIISKKIAAMNTGYVWLTRPKDGPG
jgi:hypothetical protein